MATSYDLSPLYRHSTSHFVASCPGTILSTHGSKLILRSQSTLQVIRTWTLSTTSASTFNVVIGRHYVLAHNPNLALAWVMNPNEDDPVAKLEIGQEGSCGMTWDPAGRTVLSWTDNRVRPYSAMILLDPTLTGHSFQSGDDARYLALLERHSSRDCIAIYDTLSDYTLIRNIVIQDPTSDLVGLKWSPCGRYLAAWSSITHYYLHVYSLDGRLLSTFSPYSTADSDDASRPRREPARVDRSVSSWVGLGIKSVEWTRDGLFLAVGGYDGKIRILSKVASWNVVAELSCPAIRISNPTTVWREPGTDWVKNTLGKGIISFDQVDTPLVVSNEQAVPVDATKPFPKIGWSKLRWSKKSNWLVGYNQSYPNHLYIFTFLDASNVHLNRPRLETVIILNNPPKQFEFEPVHESLVILSGSKSLVVWTPPLDSGATKESGNVGLVEGIGIPLSESQGEFEPNQIEFAPPPSSPNEEPAWIVGEKNGLFCLVYPV
ncbi:uncharacterized protein JCM15063_006072 [Sporobolomyces koalae]|uniref:uncharacterized protein n=1 Tax=Sporobolomyces koalae TaxID=500713 RepID=UPI00317371F3